MARRHIPARPPLPFLGADAREGVGNGEGGVRNLFMQLASAPLQVAAHRPHSGIFSCFFDPFPTLSQSTR
eukprot:6829993-Pyramimonas_sp.AAC.1